MKNPIRNVVVEYKNRRALKKKNSLWGNLDLKSISRDVEADSLGNGHQQQAVSHDSIAETPEELAEAASGSEPDVVSPVGNDPADRLSSYIVDETKSATDEAGAVSTGDDCTTVSSGEIKEIPEIFESPDLTNQPLRLKKASTHRKAIADDTGSSKHTSVEPVLCPPANTIGSSLLKTRRPESGLKVSTNAFALNLRQQTKSKTLSLKGESTVTAYDGTDELSALDAENAALKREWSRQLEAEHKRLNAMLLSLEHRIKADN